MAITKAQKAEAKARKEEAARKFGANLRELREQRGFTPHQIAEPLAQTPDSILKYERGVREPALSQLLALSDIFQVSVDRLLKGGEFRPRAGRIVPIRRTP